jgi:flagellar assembly factor FliW
MSATLINTRFGDLEVPQDTIVDLPEGLIGIPGRRYAVLSLDDGPFRWLQSLEDPSFALPVCDPRAFFGDVTVEISEQDRERIGLDEGGEAVVWTTVRATQDGEWFANLRAPLVLVGTQAWQVINQAPDAPLRAPLARTERQAA